MGRVGSADHPSAVPWIYQVFMSISDSQHFNYISTTWVNVTGRNICQVPIGILGPQ